jgi:hypothetical protein
MLTVITITIHVYGKDSVSFSMTHDKKMDSHKMIHPIFKHQSLKLIMVESGIKHHKAKPNQSNSFHN